MSLRNKPKAGGAEELTMDRAKIRYAAKGDVAAIADLVVRLKRLNNEFDPLFGVTEEARTKAEAYISDTIGSKKNLLLVVTTGSKIIGVLRAEIRERLFYHPNIEGHITEMYILPEYRRSQLGRELLDRASSELVKMGAEIICADLPSRNEIGVQFYTKRGFRRLIETYARMPQ